MLVDAASAAAADRLRQDWCDAGQDGTHICAYYAADCLQPGWRGREMAIDPAGVDWWTALWLTRRIRLGEPPSPVPEALADILLQLVANQQNLTSATGPSCRWLSPGKRAGQPLHPRTLLPLIHQLGIPAQATRVAALRQLVLQVPAPVIADALGYHNQHITKVWAETGGNWKTYTLGDHTR